MLLSLRKPFALSLTLIEEERRYGSSHFEVALFVERFDERLRLDARIWVANDEWDRFVAQLAAKDLGKTVLRDLSNEFSLQLTTADDRADVALSIAARHHATPDVAVTVSAAGVDHETADHVRRAFIECKCWWHLD